MTAQFGPGDYVVVTKKVPETWYDKVAVGTVIRIDMVEPALRKHDEGFGEVGWTQEAFYSGWSNGRGTVDVPQDCVGPALERVLPTPGDLIDTIRQSIFSAWDLDVLEVTKDGDDGGFEAVAKTKNGYGFYFAGKIQLTDLGWYDD